MKLAHRNKKGSKGSTPNSPGGIVSGVVVVNEITRASNNLIKISLGVVSATSTGQTFETVSNVPASAPSLTSMTFSQSSGLFQPKAIYVQDDQVIVDFGTASPAPTTDAGTLWIAGLDPSLNFGANQQLVGGTFEVPAHS